MEPPPPEGQTSPKRREVALVPSFTPDVDGRWDELRKGRVKNRSGGFCFCFTVVFTLVGDASALVGAGGAINSYTMYLYCS